MLHVADGRLDDRSLIDHAVFAHKVTMEHTQQREAHASDLARRGSRPPGVASQVTCQGEAAHDPAAILASGCRMEESRGHRIWLAKSRNMWLAEEL